MNRELLNLLDDKAVAETLNVSIATVRRWRLLRQGPPWKKLGALVRYDPRDISAWLDSCPTGGQMEGR